MNQIVNSAADAKRLRSAGGRIGLRSVTVTFVARDANAHQHISRLANTISRDLNVCGCIPAAIAVVVSLCAYALCVIYAPSLASVPYTGKFGWGLAISLAAALVGKLGYLAFVAIRLRTNVARLEAALATADQRGQALPLAHL